MLISVTMKKEILSICDVDFKLLNTELLRHSELETNDYLTLVLYTLYIYFLVIFFLLFNVSRFIFGIFEVNIRHCRWHKFLLLDFFRQIFKATKSYLLVLLINCFTFEIVRAMIIIPATRIASPVKI